ncbi:cell cycle arrest protein Bub3p [Monosporozyma servazzii]
MESNTVLKFPNVSKDYISDLKYISEISTVIVSSWDGTLSLYKIIPVSGSYKISLDKQFNVGFSILSCCYSREGIYIGGVQGELTFLDFQAQVFQPIEDNKATSGIIRIIPYYNNFIVGSWDGTLQVIDHVDHSIKLVKIIENAKILTMDSSDEHLVVSTTGNKIKLYKLPLNDMNDGSLIDSVLKYQIRDIKILPDGSGYVIGSIDGRVAVEYFNDPSKQFAFRCHRKKLTDVQFVFPVNSLLFRPNSNTLFTGGADGCVSCWSLTDRRKVRQFNKIDEKSVVKMAGGDRVLFVATSDDSFKTNAIITDDIELQPSSIYLVVLDN